jgi:hypothetical protein
MKRDYADGVKEDVIFFVGTEIERTPAFGMKTLFVTGIQDVNTILEHYRSKGCEHIFFGANHSFHPGTNFPADADAWDEWDNMIKYFLDQGIPCTLDLPYSHAEALLESILIEQDNFIPQIRIPLPYIKQYNYNTTIKLDDKDFNATNPGVWCHSLHDLMDRSKFTDWAKYGLDEIIN